MEKVLKKKIEKAIKDKILVALYVDYYEVLFGYLLKHKPLYSLDNTEFVFRQFNPEKKYLRCLKLDEITDIKKVKLLEV